MDPVTNLLDCVSSLTYMTVHHLHNLTCDVCVSVRKTGESWSTAAPKADAVENRELKDNLFMVTNKNILAPLSTQLRLKNEPFHKCTTVFWSQIGLSIKSPKGVQKAIYYLSHWRKLVPIFSLYFLARALKPLEEDYFDKLHNKLHFSAVHLHHREWNQCKAACFHELYWDMMASAGFLRIH